MYALMLSLLLTVGLAAQDEITLVGTVIDANTEQAIAKATVTIAEDVEVVTDNRGVFLVKGDYSGEITLTIEADGYETKTLKVTVNGDSNLTLELEPAEDGSEE